MEFKFRNVVLRDMGEADIEDENPLEHGGDPVGPVGRPLGEPGGAQILLTRRPIAGQSWSS